MTTKKATIWQKINTPLTWKILPWVVLGIWILWFIFKGIPDSRKTKEENIQLRSEIKTLERGKIQDSIFREDKNSEIAVLRKAVQQKQTEKIRIYERIQNDIHHYDTASVVEYQSFFDTRYNPNTQSNPNTRPGTGND